MRSAAVWMVLAVLLGLGLRSFHYLRDRVVWQDEAAVLVNVLDKDYGELLGPLEMHQAAPPLFLWMEKAASEAIGDEAWALRLPSYLASCGAILLVAAIARKLLAPVAAAWAVVLFACSDQLCWHACEAKPYSFDVLAAALLGFLFVNRDRIGLVGQLILFAAAAPLVMWTSYPGCFLYGGVLVALLPAAWGNRRAWFAYAFLTAIVFAAFLALGSVRDRQHDPALARYWTGFFPDWDRPALVPFWSAIATLEVGRYACKPLGEGIAILALMGGWRLWRDGRRDVVALLAVPVGLALAASLVHKYPYGGVRLMAFAAPAVVLLAAAALPAAFAWLAARHRLAPAALVVFLLMPAGLAAVRVACPWTTADSRSAAAYVEAARRHDDPVVGNDWTHRYYFRRLGRAFHPFDAVPPNPGPRVWVVWTEQSPAADRLANAATLVPAGWTAVNRFDSEFTTVALFSQNVPVR